jgi:hypothetical protein
MKSVILIMIEIIQFLAYQFGLNIKALGVKRHQFGGATVTSFGSFGFRDVTAPFTRNKFFDLQVSHDEELLFDWSQCHYRQADRQKQLNRYRESGIDQFRDRS